jgi:hypothetical protein
MIAKLRWCGVACRGTLLFAAALTLLDAGCVQPGPDEEEGVDDQQGELAAANFDWLKTRLWPNGVKNRFTSPDDAI